MPLVTLTTDFGAGSPYVAAMKGVILSLCPQAALVDITHSIPPQDIRAGALALEQATPWFPPGTIHVAVVDPGVGTSRPIIYCEFGQQRYLCPDNGLISRLAQHSPPGRIIAVSDPRWWLESVSSTFHGRDIMAPVAARLAGGLDPGLLGPRVADFATLAWAEAERMGRRIAGQVEAVDSFGNLITNITAEQLADAPRSAEQVRITCGEHETFGIFNTYGDQPAMTLMALVGSGGKLELAIVDENASMMLGERAGAKVEVSWE